MITAQTQSRARLAAALVPAFAGLFRRAIPGEGPETYALADPAVPTVWESPAAFGGRC
jgi:hypothetical protein